MRALVVTSNPATTASEPETPASALSDLGCEVVAVGYDVDQLPEDIELQRPSVVVVDAGAHLEVGRAALGGDAVKVRGLDQRPTTRLP